MKFFLRLGLLKKTLIIPFLLSLSLITITIFNSLYPEKKNVKLYKKGQEIEKKGDIKIIFF